MLRRLRRSRLILLSTALLAVLLLASCKKEETMASETTAPQAAPAAEKMAARDDAAAPPAGAAPASPGTPAPAARSRLDSRKLVRTVDLALEVAATTPVAEAIQKVALDLGGYVGSVNAERCDDLLYYRLTIRVPVERLDSALAAVKKLAVRVDHEQVATEDVTDQYVDLDARVRTLQATERELQALLAESRQKSRKVEEIMAVYRELTEIRSQIEQIAGQLANLDKLAAFSTLNVQLTPTEAARPVAVAGWQPSETVRGSFRTLVSMLRSLVDFLIFAVIVLLPAALVAVVAWKVLARVWRRLRRSPR
jgi:hypothetical protein